MKKFILAVLSLLTLALLALPAHGHFVRGRAVGAFVGGYGFGHAAFVAPVYTAAPAVIAVQPVVVQPVVVQPQVVQPQVVQPIVAQPVVAQPVVAQPIVQAAAVAIQPAYAVAPVVAAVGHVHSRAFVVRQRAAVVVAPVRRTVIVRPAGVRVRVR